MPTISVNKRHLADKLNSIISDDLIEEMLFSFGLELDDIVHEGGETFYKIEIPANRYDLLCLEGLTNALLPFNNKGAFIDIEPTSSPYVVVQENDVYRPYIACAVINDIDFNQSVYDSFIDYQDKLHSSLGRNRSIIAIGTHDLDTFEFPVFYRAEDPEKIRFTPLNQEGCMSGLEIHKFYSSDNKMKSYAKLLQEKYPVFVDNNNEVLSLPPLINSNRTKISLKTKNVFVEVTGTDLNKVNIALKMVLYCFRGKSILQVEIKKKEETTEERIDNIVLSDHKEAKRYTPEINEYTFEFGLFEMQDELGIKIYPEEIKKLLEKMMHSVSIYDEKIVVKVSDVRSDVLHKVDIVEDLAIAFGYNNFYRRNPLIYTIGNELPINKFSNRLREEMAQMGYNEVLTLSLLSKKDSLGDQEYVTLDNPKSSECEVLRNMLLPGLLKTAHINQHTGVPMKIFEIGDCVDGTGKNKRKLCVCFVNKVDNLENVIGACSLLLQKLGLGFKYVEKEVDYYFEGRSCEIIVNSCAIGLLGVVHCDVCVSFRIPFPVSSFEIDLDLLFELYNEK